MANVSSTAYVNPDIIIVDSNPALAYLSIDNKTYSKAFASSNDQGRLQVKAESINMLPQLHSGGSSLFYSMFKVKGNNDTPVHLNFSVQVTADLEAISPLHPISYASARADFSSLFYGDVSGLQLAEVLI